MRDEDPKASQRTGAIGRRDLLAMATLASGAALPPVGLARAAGDTTAKREAVVLQPGDLTGLDPHGAITTSDVAVLSNVFDPLVRRRPDGTLQAALATGWTRPTATTWHFILRAGVRWHDGTPFSSVDAKYSLDRTYDPSVKAARLCPCLGTIARTEAPDASTLVIHTKRPDPLLPARLAFGGPMVPWSYVDRVGYTVFNQRPVGTGPLQILSWKPGAPCVLAANPQYWEGRIDVDRVVVRPVPDPAERVAALFRGEADLITRLPPAAADRVAAHPATRVIGALYAGLYVLLVNVWVPPLHDPLVRQALSLAIDRVEIVRTLWRGRAEVATGPICRGDEHYDAALPRLPYDPAAARERLRRAGYRGAPVVLETTAGLFANDWPMAEAIAEMWEDVGVNVVLEVIDGGLRSRKYRQRSFKGLTWSDPTSTIRHPEGMMGRLLGSDQPHDYWRHPEFDRLAVLARASADDAVQASAYRAMTAILLEENPWIVILQPYEESGIRRHVEFTPSADLRLELRGYNFRMRRA